MSHEILRTPLERATINLVACEVRRAMSKRQVEKARLALNHALRPIRINLTSQRELTIARERLRIAEDRLKTDLAACKRAQELLTLQADLDVADVAPQAVGCG